MGNKFLAFFLIAITSVVVFPAENNAKTLDSNRTVSERSTELQYQRRGSYRQRRRYNRRSNRRSYPRRYRNYGQYRRTRNRNYGQYRSRQNRRYRNSRRSRLVRQYYYRSGRRYVRYVRVYY